MPEEYGCNVLSLARRRHRGTCRELAYVAAFDPAGEQRDAMTVVDCDVESVHLRTGGGLDSAADRGQ